MPIKRAYSPHFRLRFLHQRLILGALRDRWHETGPSLSAQFNIDVRSVYRIIADLKMLGYKIDGEAGVGYILRNYQSLIRGVDRAMAEYNHHAIATILEARNKKCDATPQVSKPGTPLSGRTRKDETRSPEPSNA